MVKTKSLIAQLNKASENLSPENKNIFGDIVVFIRTSNIKTRDAEEFLQQILDSFLNAEQQGLSIENVLGTTDIKHYCEEIVNTYKASYNFLSLSGENVMYAGSLIVILTIISFITQSIPTIISNGFNKLNFNLNINLGVILQFLLIGLMVIAIMTYTKKNCFKKPVKGDGIKEFFKLWVIMFLWMCIVIACVIFLNKILVFGVNVFIVLIVGFVLYFVGSYFSEK